MAKLHFPTEPTQNNGGSVEMGECGDGGVEMGECGDGGVEMGSVEMGEWRWGEWKWVNGDEEVEMGE